MSSARDRDGEADRSRPKRPYRSPHLLTYGDLRQITQANVQGTGNIDNKVFVFKTGARL